MYHFAKLCVCVFLIILTVSSNCNRDCQEKTPQLLLQCRASKDYLFYKVFIAREFLVRTHSTYSEFLEHTVLTGSF